MIPAPLEGNHAASPAEENPICAKEPKPKEPKKSLKMGTIASILSLLSHKKRNFARSIHD